MKNQSAFFLTVGVGSLAAFALRLIQNRTGFEPDTGLPIPGNPAALALILLLAGLAAALFFFAGKLSQAGENPPAFPADFSTNDPAMLLLPVAGSFLTAISGAVNLLMGLGILSSLPVELPGFGTVFLFVSDKLSPAFHLVLGAASLAAAAALFYSAVVCRRQGQRQAGNDGLCLLIPVVNLVVHLVITYRTDTLNPATQVYYVELLTLTFLILGFSRLSSFAFGAGRTKIFAACSGMAVILTATVLSDSSTMLSSLLLYLGSAAALFGYLLLLLAEPAAPAEEPVEEE